MRSERAIQPILMAQRAQIRPKSGQNQAKIRPERAKLRPRGGDGRTDGRTEGRTDVWKFPPVSHRTSALWGRCPTRERQRQRERKRERERERDRERER